MMRYLCVFHSLNNFFTMWSELCAILEIHPQMLAKMAGYRMVVDDRKTYKRKLSVKTSLDWATD